MRICEIVRIEKEHLDGIAEIEKLSFAFPTSAEAIERMMDFGYVGFVCVCDGKAAAFADMISVYPEGQIRNIAVHPDMRRMGLGRAVTSELIAYSKEVKLESLVLEVRESNFPAISLYKSLGFEQIGLRKNFYSKPVENGLIMEIKL